MKKGFADLIVLIVVAPILLVAIKIALLGYFSLTEDTPKDRPAKKRVEGRIFEPEEVRNVLTENLLYEIYDGSENPTLDDKVRMIEAQVERFNGLFFEGRKPTYKDTERVISAYEKHLPELIASPAYNPEKTRKNLNKLLKELHYSATREECLSAFYELKRTVDELIKVIDMQAIQTKQVELGKRIQEEVRLVQEGKKDKEESSKTFISIFYEWIEFLTRGYTTEK